MIPSKRPQVEPLAPPPLLHRRFRANRDYRLVAHTELEASEREVFAGLAKDTNYFGLLIPLDVVQSGVKAVDQDVARLFRALSHPARLPLDLFRAEESIVNVRVATLVLDGVLEVEDEGTFLAGPAAEPLMSGTGARAGGRNALSTLSREALRLAWEVPTEDPARLSTWIYGYNTIPLSPAWLRRLDGFLTKLGLEEDARNHRRLAADFHPISSESWLSWQRRDQGARGDDGHLGYKLYVSPHPKALIEAFDSVLDVVVTSGVVAFKLGKGPLGLLRPDKLVAYLDGWESLHALATRMKELLAGVVAQGVPFTAPLTDEGLLSWGMDPPPQTRLSGWGEVESWRLWLTNRLARALLHARSRGADASQSLAYASTRLQLEGVDTDLWVPADSLWAEEGAVE